MGIKFTQKEFEDKLHSKYPNIKITGKYDGYKNKIKYICPCCNHEHDSFPQSLMQGYFCRKNIGKNNPNKKDTRSFIKEIELIDPKIKVIGQYINANEPISFICSCGTETKREPAQMLLGYTKCPKCSQNRITFKEYRDKLLKLRPDIKLFTNIRDDDFIKKREKISYMCECGNIDEKSMESLLNGNKCTLCTGKKISKKSRKPHKQYVSEVHMISPDVEILSEYLGGDKPIKFKCTCGNIDIKNQARELIRKTCCCSLCSKSAKKTTEQFISEMRNINPNIVILGEYINAETPIEYICECGTRHKSSPSLLLMGHKCGHCNMSKSEYTTKYYLEDHNVEYIFNYKFDDCINKIPLKFDFYIPKYNMCIELDGEHHFKPVTFKGISYELALERHQYTKKLDEIKNIYCEKNMINLVRIPYWDFSNIENILDKSFLFEGRIKRKER